MMYRDYYVNGKSPTQIEGFLHTVLFNRLGFTKEDYEQYLLDKQELERCPASKPVSYTHLTLPTIA